jgi:hypothetical protein
MPVPEQLTHGPFTTAMGLTAGVTSRQLQAASYRRLFFGVYIDARTHVDLEVLADAISLVLPPGAVVAGTTAALLHGADVRRLGDNAVDVVVPRHDQVRRPGVRARSALVEPADAMTVFGIPCLSPIRTTFDLARNRDLVDAVVGIDAMLNRGGCRLKDLAAYIDDCPGWRGIRYARQALPHAEPLSESVMETRQRLALVLNGLPRPRAQVDLFERSGPHIARLDLGYEEWRVGIEYDGEVHRDSWRYDLERQERIRDLGWWHRRYTSIHARDGWLQMVGQVRGALTAAGWHPTS